MSHYAFTIKYQNSDWKTFTEEEMKKRYDAIITEWESKGAVIEYKVFEHDKQLRVHLHGIVELGDRFYLKRLFRKGYTVKIVMIYDNAGWLSYLQKEQKHTNEDDGFKMPTHSLFPK